MALRSQKCTYFFLIAMKELLVEVVNKESNVSIYLCKLVKLCVGNHCRCKTHCGKHILLSPNSSETGLYAFFISPS